MWRKESALIIFIGEKRMQGKIGSAENSWNGVIRWSSNLDSKALADVTNELNMKRDQLPSAPWLTVFEDSSSPRPGTDDLYFSISDNQEKILPRPIYEEHDERVPVPVDLIALIILIWIFLRSMLKKRRLRQSAT
jgi:hypothetical protein